jgi:hypothetical protein
MRRRDKRQIKQQEHTQEMATKAKSEGGWWRLTVDNPRKEFKP